MDKNRSHFLARFRGLIQAGAALLTNIHLPNFLKGTLYQGKGKYLCVPGLNCYSCPGVLRAISTIVPARWYIDAARKLMIQGVEARFVMQDVWAMVITEAVLLGISLKKFKVRL